MPRYRVRSIAPGALVGHGAIAGGLIAGLPGAAVAWLAVTAVREARGTLESWRSVRLPLPAPLPSPTADMVDLLKLTSWLAAVRSWDASAPLVFAGITLAALLIGAAAGALGALLAALLFNAAASLGRGVVVQLEELPDDD